MAARVLTAPANITGVGSVSSWIKFDYYQTPFNVDLAVYFDSALAATLAVQYVVDDQSQTSDRDVYFSQSGTTTVTVKDSGNQNLAGGPWGHGLLSNDIVFPVGSQAGIDSPLVGYPITVVDQFTYTFTAPMSQTIVNQHMRTTSARIFTHQVLQGLTARAQSNIAYSTWMARLICTAFTTPGKAFLVSMQGK